MDDVFPDEAGTTIRAVAGVWLRNVRVGLLLAAWGVALGARVLSGAWSGVDAAIAAAVICLQPFSEWTIHRFVLHARPRVLAGRPHQSLLAREHMRHHANPRQLDAVFIPLPWVVGAVTLPWLVLVAPGLSAPQDLTFLFVAFTLLLLYEWTHFLIHTPYRPRRRHYRDVRRSHILHHHRNEHFWFGITVHLADHLFGTFPERSAVPPSATARSLHPPNTVDQGGASS